MKLVEYAQKLKELWQEDTTYMVYIVPTNGKKPQQKNIQTNFLRKAVYGLCGVAALGIAAMCVMQYTIYQNMQSQKELAEYRATKAAQEQKLKEMSALTAKVQQDMAALSKVEDQVRQQMEKSGMHVPKKTLNPAQYGGKGGNGDMSNMLTRMDVVIEQNKNMHAILTAQTKDWQNYLKTIKQDNLRKDAMPNHWPLAGGTITSRFGGRRDPVVGGRENHAGIDVGAGHGTPIYAAGSGYVQHAGWYYGYGNYIKINHDYGYQTAYGHLSSIAIQPGTYVKKGQFIGRVGSTGYSTGPHLHFELIKNGKQINPMTMF
ncbi:MAG: M23 family metallopeptidase [Phascolarctobacterium sp.]|nr:M23 family metallopeptidase [Phascolarctobacterium sp.]